MTTDTQSQEMAQRVPQGQLSFALNMPGTVPVQLPVEVRRSNLALEARVLSSHSVDVAPGTYYVTAKLPNGEELYNRVDVEAGESAVVRLVQESAEEAPKAPATSPAYDWRGVSKGVRPLRGDTELEGLGPAPPIVKLRAFEGNILHNEHREVSHFIASVEQEEGRIRVKTYGEPLLVQVLAANVTAWNAALPAWRANGCDLILILSSDGLVDIDVQLANEEANLLLRYFRQGFLKEAATMATFMQAEDLLRTKMADPVAAAVGAYALLRFGELDRLHDWTENLKNWFSWLPDGLIVRAEHLARVGEHDQALDLFLALPERGLPFFSEGLTYVLNRLRLYLSMGEKQFESDVLERAQALHKHLQQYSPYVNFDKRTLTFTGQDLSHPNEEPLSSEEFSSAEGADIELA